MLFLYIHGAMNIVHYSCKRNIVPFDNTKSRYAVIMSYYKERRILYISKYTCSMNYSYLDHKEYSYQHHTKYVQIKT